jgi:hypothetical protein
LERKKIRPPVLVTLEPPSGSQVPVLGSAGNTGTGDDPSTGTWDPEGRSRVTSAGFGIDIVISLTQGEKMNTAVFNDIVENRIKTIRKVLTAKGAEYAPGADRLHNFNRAALMLGCTRERALIGMWAKHIVSILDIVDSIKTRKPPVALIEEKLGDAINYLILLEAILKEEIQPKRK